MVNSKSVVWYIVLAERACESTYLERGGMFG